VPRPTDFLRQLAVDLASKAPQDCEVAVSRLSSLTIFLENHDAILRAGVLPTLMHVVEQGTTMPQVHGRKSLQAGS
jgi:hypothetical protein